VKYLLPIVAAVLIVGSLQLTRSGYSVDEEFTVFAVRGIHAHGLPLLPSGLLYDRGVAYSYAAWAANAITGSELPAYRAIGLLCAIASLLLAFLLVRRLSNERAALMAAVLVALSVPFWAVATTGRFYAPFLALYLATLLALPSNALLALLFAFGSRLTHELAFTLVAVPLVCWLLDRERRRLWLRATIAIGAGLVLAQLLLFALHGLAPSSGETMVRRFFLWQVLNLFERPGPRQFGVALVVMVIGWLVAPARAWLTSVTALSLAAMIAAFSIAQASNVAPLSLPIIRDVLDQGSRYPLHMFWHIAQTMPLTLMIAGAMLLLRLCGAAGAWPQRDRALHALWLGWVLWFGVIDSGITTNYLLLPIGFMVMAIAVDATAILIDSRAPARAYFSASRPAYAALMALVLIVGVDQWRKNPLESARPTIETDAIANIRATLQPTDRIVCTDELGCLMTIGRIDRWLALDNYVRERFVVKRADGSETGVYSGVPVAFRPTDLFEPNADGSLPNRILIVDIFKEYPIGNSQSWLPRAVQLDGVPVTPLLETPQLRVVEISQPERHASR
jgi:hypothetical protein